MSEPFLINGALGLCSGLCLISAMNALGAEEGDNTPFTNLMVAYVGTPTPKITEDSKDSGGANTSYEWDGMDSRGAQVLVSLTHGIVHPQGGFVWGGNLNVAIYNITPSSYEVGGVDFPNSSGATLRYETVGIDLTAGYQYGISNTPEFHSYVEIMPLIGFGVAHASSEVHSNGSYDKADGTGFYYQAGARIGAYITDRRWTFGVIGSFVASNGQVDIDFPGGFSSELSFESVGFGFGAAFGYRF